MGTQTRTVLKTYTETGDIPTEAQFTDIIDSCVNINDDGILVSGEDAIVAFAGGGQANATQLTKKVNHVTVVAAPNDSTKLPVGVPGMSLMFWNDGVNICDIYPAAGGEILNLGVNNPANINPNNNIILGCYAANQWMYVS